MRDILHVHEHAVLLNILHVHEHAVLLILQLVLLHQQTDKLCIVQLNSATEIIQDHLENNVSESLIKMFHFLTCKMLTLYLAIIAGVSSEE